MAKILIATVKEFTCKCGLKNCTLHDGRHGFGIEAGRKWHAYLFAAREDAQKFADALKSQIAIEVNVGYPAPFAWSARDRKVE